MEKVIFENIQDFKSKFPIYLKNNLGRGFYISKSFENNENYTYKIANSIPEIIDNDKSNDRFIRFCTIDPVFVVDLEFENDKIFIQIPERPEIAKEVLKKLKIMTIHSENALLKNTYDKLINIPLVQTAMKPLKDILISLHDFGQMPISEFVQGRKNLDQAKRYLELMKSLQFISIENKICYPEIEFKKYQNKKSSDVEMYNSMLSSILHQRYTYIKEYLHLTSLLPYIRVANSYYFPSHKSQTLLEMSTMSLNEHHNHCYGSKKPIRKLKSYIGEIKSVDVFEKEEEYIVGKDELFQKYSKEIPNTCIIPSS